MYDEFDYEINRPKLRKPALGFGDIGGAGQIIYNLVRFEEYDWDNVKDRDVIIPLCDANHSFILPNEKSPTGKEILTSLYNLAKKINDLHDERSFLYRIVDWCKQYGNPYAVDELYAMVTDPGYDHAQDYWLEKTGTFELNRFMYDLGRLYTTMAFYFALENLVFDEEAMAYHLSEEERFFEGLPFFEKYKYFDDLQEEEIDLSTAEGDLRKEIALLAKYRKEHPEPDTDEDCLDDDHPDEEDEVMFAGIPYDDYDDLYDKLIDIMPSFTIRVRRDPKTQRTVFAAEVESVFDIAWLTLARKIADDVPPEEKGKHQEIKGPIKICPFCGDAFIQNSNRQITCGKIECNRERTKRNKRRERAKKRQADAAQDKNATYSNNNSSENC